MATLTMKRKTSRVNMIDHQYPPTNLTWNGITESMPVGKPAGGSYLYLFFQNAKMRQQCGMSQEAMQNLTDKIKT